MGLINALEEFDSKNVHLVIKSDYEGVQKWTNGEWKAKKPYIADLVKQAQELIKSIENNGGSVKLQWVKGHSGEKGNEAVDKVAKSRNSSNDITALIQSQKDSTSSYFTNADLPQFKKQVEDAIQRAKDSGKTIVITAELKEKAPELYNYLQSKLNELQQETQINPQSQNDNSGHKPTAEDLILNSVTLDAPLVILDEAMKDELMEELAWDIEDYTVIFNFFSGILESIYRDSIRGSSSVTNLKTFIIDLIGFNGYESLSEKDIKAVLNAENVSTTKLTGLAAGVYKGKINMNRHTYFVLKPQEKSLITEDNMVLEKRDVKHLKGFTPVGEKSIRKSEISNIFENQITQLIITGDKAEWDKVSKDYAEIFVDNLNPPNFASNDIVGIISSGKNDTFDIIQKAIDAKVIFKTGVSTTNLLSANKEAVTITREEVFRFLEQNGYSRSVDDETLWFNLRFNNNITEVEYDGNKYFIYSDGRITKGDGSTIPLVVNPDSILAKAELDKGTLREASDSAGTMHYIFEDGRVFWGYELPNGLIVIRAEISDSKKIEEIKSKAKIRCK